jgi:hypothetical protein
MFLLNWYRQYLQLKSDFKPEPPFCESCEVLKGQISILNTERDKLLAKVLKEPEPVIIQDNRVATTPGPRMVPWKVRQQMLEQEDRQKAAAMRSAAKPDSDDKKGIEVLEKELDIVSKERDATEGREKQNAG